MEARQAMSFALPGWSQQILAGDSFGVDARWIQRRRCHLFDQRETAWSTLQSKLCRLVENRPIIEEIRGIYSESVTSL